jgi:surface protein
MDDYFYVFLITFISVIIFSLIIYFRLLLIPQIEIDENVDKTNYNIKKITLLLNEMESKTQETLTSMKRKTRHTLDKMIKQTYETFHKPVDKIAVLDDSTFFQALNYYFCNDNSVNPPDGISGKSIGNYWSETKNKITTWNVSSVTNMSNSFNITNYTVDISEFNEDLSSWDIGLVTDTSYMFYGCENYDYDLSSWKTGNLIDASYMFWGCTDMDMDLYSWNTKKLQNSSLMFHACKNFDGDLSNWKTENLIDASYMFSYCDIFNSDVSRWNTKSLINAEGMFNDCLNFNINISRWNVISVTNMRQMFRNCSSLDMITQMHYLNVQPNTSVDDMFLGAYIMTNDSSWNETPSPIENYFGFTKDITVKLTDTTFYPALKYYFGDVSNVVEIEGVKQIYGIPVEFIGQFSNSKTKNLISTWDVLKVTNMSNAFNVTVYLPVDISSFNEDLSSWILMGVTDTSYMFYGCADITSISFIFPTTLTTAENMFYNCKKLEIISDLDLSNIKILNSMFTNCISLKSLNLTIKNINYSNCMFSGCKQLSSIGSLENLDFSSVIEMNCMFKDCRKFYMDLIGLPVPQSNDGVFTNMFDGAVKMRRNKWKKTPLYKDFNFPISPAILTGGDGKIANPSSTDSYNVALNYYFGVITSIPNGLDPTITPESIGLYSSIGTDNDTSDMISTWNVSGVTNMYGSFNTASYSDYTNITSFNKDLSKWDTGKCSNMSYMFQGCFNFEGNGLENFKVEYVTKFHSMFEKCSLCKPVFNKWNLKDDSVDLSQMFNYAYIIIATTRYINNNTDDDTGTPTLSYFNFQPSPNVAILSDDNFRDVLSYYFGGENADITNITNINPTITPETIGQYWNDTKELISTWDVSRVTNMSNAFNMTFLYDQNTQINTSYISKSESFNIDISSWNTENVTNVQYMFRSCKEFNQDLCWNTIKISNFNGMFYDCIIFNGDISLWDTSSGTDFSSMFYNCNNFNIDISSWIVSNMKFGNSMFNNCFLFNQDLNKWDVSNATNFSNMFYGCSNFNGNLSSWNAPLVTSMYRMFYGCSSLTGDGLFIIDKTNSVTNINYMFYGCTSLVNVSVFSNWIFSNIKDASYMFSACTSFKCEDMFSISFGEDANIQYMFYNCTSMTTCDGVDFTALFDMTNVKTVDYMFNKCLDLNIKLAPWNTISENSSFTNMFSDESKMVESGWKTTPLYTDFLEEPVVISDPIFNDETYKNALLYYFGITDLNNDSDTTGTVTTSNVGTYAVNPERISVWDVSKVTDMSNSFSFAYYSKYIKENNIQFTKYELTTIIKNISNFNEDISSWNVENVIIMNEMFSGCVNITGEYISSWNVENVTHMSRMFFGCINLNFNPSWNTISLTDTSFMFYGCVNFNGNVSSFTMINVQYMRSMFEKCLKFNPTGNSSISEWDLQNVIKVNGLFKDCISFNDNLSSWKIGKNKILGEKSFSNLFKGCIKFNPTGNTSLSKWDFSIYKFLNGTFSGCVLFNDDISSYKLNNVISARKMFKDCISLSYSGTVNLLTNCIWVKDLSYMFTRCKLFNPTSFPAQLVNKNPNGDYIKVTIKKMFSGCSVFNCSLENWVTTYIINMNFTFENCVLFSKDLIWDTKNVRTMIGTFFNCSIFNGNVSSWDLSNVKNSSFMFFRCILFNPKGDTSLSKWSTKNLVYAIGMFELCGNFNDDITSWTVLNVLFMNSMFKACANYRKSLSSWIVNTNCVFTGMFQFTPLFDDENVTNGTPDLSYFQTSIVTFSTTYSGQWEQIINDNIDVLNSVSGDPSKISDENVYTDGIDQNGYYSYKPILVQLSDTTIKETTPTLSTGSILDLDSKETYINNGLFTFSSINSINNDYAYMNNDYITVSGNGVKNVGIGVESIIKLSEQQGTSYLYICIPYDSTNQGYNGVYRYTITSVTSASLNLDPTSGVLIAGTSSVALSYPNENIFGSVGSDGVIYNVYFNSDNTILTISSYSGPELTINNNYYWGATSDSVNVYTTSYKNIITLNDNIEKNLLIQASTSSEIPNETPFTFCDENGNDISLSSTTFTVSSAITVIQIPGENPSTNLFNFTPKVNETKMLYYLPTKLPCGDYFPLSTLKTGVSISSTNPKVFPLSIQGLGSLSSELSVTADQCRWLWRLGNYVRSLNSNTSTSIEKNIANILLSSTYATYLSFPNPDVEGNALSLYLTVYTLLSGSQNSADMVPPFLTAVCALDLYSSASTDYETNLDNLSSMFDMVNKLMVSPGSLSNIISSLDNGNIIWPFFDCINAGGQQLGLAGCGMGCTTSFMLSDDYNIMKSYTNTSDVKLNGSYLGNNGMTNDIIKNISDAYKIIYQRGNEFKSYSSIANTPPDNSQTYAQILGTKAYLTNIRIRGVNILEKDELSFGLYTNTSQPLNSDNVPSWISTTTAGKSYVPTFFPIHAIPDSGWGSVTVEIFSYQGITAVIRNDYEGFCRWHRMFYYILFVQNGGNMEWNSNSDIQNVDDYEPMEDNTVNNKSNWIPPYLDPSTPSNYIDDGVSLKNYTIFSGDNTWPTETASYSNNVTNRWANRMYPTRGSSNDDTDIHWTTPSYTMGYSPVWVSGGINNDFSETGYPRDDGNDSDPSLDSTYPSSTTHTKPLWEALNPYFSSIAGLYSATDGDMNSFIAYHLAFLKWGKTPSLTDSGSNTNPYNCDIADLDGVKTATEQVPSDLFSVTDKIGYGFSITSDISISNVTWKFMRNSIAKTLISTQGLTGINKNDSTTKYGNFVGYMNEINKRIVTLGHDTNTSGIKADYIDLQVFNIAKDLDFST